MEGYNTCQSLIIREKIKFREECIKSDFLLEMVERKIATSEI